MFLERCPTSTPFFVVPSNEMKQRLINDLQILFFFLIELFLKLTRFKVFTTRELKMYDRFAIVSPWKRFISLCFFRKIKNGLIDK